jgi:hypothetical protein
MAGRHKIRYRGICRLCLANEELQNSHILPEFLYKPVYDELNRMMIVGTTLDLPPTLHQQGIRERLLCSSCEQRLSRYERPSAKFFRDPRQYRQLSDGRFTRYHGLDYHSFKLFLMSIVWRAGVSNDTMFRLVQLGPHEERLRRMILNDDPGDVHEYAVTAVDSAYLPDYLKRSIVPPKPLRLDGHNCYQFVFGGLFWFFFADAHSKQFVQSELFLSRRGELIIPKDTHGLTKGLSAQLETMVQKMLTLHKQ